MASIFRQYSLLVRRRRALQERARTLQKYHAWLLTQDTLPPAVLPARKKVLIIRLDDIGDYLLFRNQLASYRQSARWKDHEVTLLGNTSWRELFAAHDASSVDDVVWVDKRTYLLDANYRWTIWSELRRQGYEVGIAPSRTRPLLLDDLCMAAAAPIYRIGSVNTYVHADWNQLSDRAYSELFHPVDRGHEFTFNAQFARWACGICSTDTRPTIDLTELQPARDPYILCFVGANTRSKRWPEKRWIEFIKRYRKSHSVGVVVAGAGTAEVTMAQNIERRTGATSIAGQVSLLELTTWASGARAVITNDTMAAHLGVSCKRPTVIIANGVNHTRFTEYEATGTTDVTTVYPDRFNRLRRRHGEISCNYEDVVTADIESIEAITVLRRLDELLNKPNAPTQPATGLARSL